MESIHFIHIYEILIWWYIYEVLSLLLIHIDKKPNNHGVPAIIHDFFFSIWSHSSSSFTKYNTYIWRLIGPWKRPQRERLLPNLRGPCLCQIIEVDHFLWLGDNGWRSRESRMTQNSDDSPCYFNTRPRRMITQGLTLQRKSLSRLFGGHWVLHSPCGPCVATCASERKRFSSFPPKIFSALPSCLVFPESVKAFKTRVYEYLFCVNMSCFVNFVNHSK